jgi:Leucine-rich repeat (LRR) protein
VFSLFPYERVFRNQIQTLPLSLTQCVNLERLHLGSNKIEYLPPEIFNNLTRLKDLFVHKNKIAVIPPEIGNLQSIQKLSFASNNIKALPDEIGACTTLEELYLSNNAKFSYFPSTAGHLRYTVLGFFSLNYIPLLDV